MNPSRRRKKKNPHEIDDDDDDDENCRACINIDDLLLTNFETNKKECPLNSNELGRASWSFLHTLAAYYPKKPSNREQEDMKSFINIFAKFYPCSHCAKDFQVEIVRYPPTVENRNSLSQWFCDQHNLVNDKLGKPRFDCARVFERWRDGWSDGRCDNEK